MGCRLLNDGITNKQVKRHVVKDRNKYLCNRSFAAGNSSRAKHKLGQNKQKDHITENCNFLCLCSFNESLALQHGGFVPGE